MMLDAATAGALSRVQSLLQTGRAAEAWMTIAPLRRAIDRHGQALRLYALAAQQAGQVDAAADALKRILALENDPPEIVGALADMLGKAGRHDDAYRHWSRLVALQPQAADAHLNRSISAANAGQFDAAVAAADEGLARFAGHARLHATRAMALKNVGRLDDALAGFAKAIAADPTRALTRHNLGVTLREACRYDEACEAFEAASRLGLKGAQFHANWAAAALEAGRVDAAADLYHRALSEQADHDEARRGLTRLEIEYRGGDKAFDYYAGRARTLGTSQAWAEYQLALISHKRYAEAADIGRQAMRAIGADNALAMTTLFAEGMSGDAAASLDAMERLPATFTETAPGLIARAQIALRANRPDHCADLCLRYNDLSPHEQSGWSLLTVAWRLLGDPREQWLCDYDRLVMVADVPSPDGSIDPERYATLVASALDPLHQTLAAPGDQSLRNGTQTSGSLFSRPDPAIQDFRRAVLKAAAIAVGGLPDDPTHPFLARKSDRFDFSGSWSVRLRGGGGHHISHFHGEGWMSSAYYARLPQQDADSRAAHQGWIEFGRPPEAYNLDLGPRRVVEPKVGKLVLFPSYLWHGTVPFGEQRGDRLTAAFDYIPL